MLIVYQVIGKSINEYTNRIVSYKVVDKSGVQLPLRGYISEAGGTLIICRPLCLAHV